MVAAETVPVIRFAGSRGQHRYFVALADSGDPGAWWILDDEAGSSWYRSIDELRTFVEELEQDAGAEPEHFGEEVPAWRALLGLVELMASRADSWRRGCLCGAPVGAPIVACPLHPAR